VSGQRHTSVRRRHCGRQRGKATGGKEGGRGRGGGREGVKGGGRTGLRIPPRNARALPSPLSDVPPRACGSLPSPCLFWPSVLPCQSFGAGPGRFCLGEGGREGGREREWCFVRN
jgi:hypothetical protein